MMPDIISLNLSRARDFGANRFWHFHKTSAYEALRMSFWISIKNRYIYSHSLRALGKKSFCILVALFIAEADISLFKEFVFIAALIWRKG